MCCSLSLKKNPLPWIPQLGSNTIEQDCFGCFNGDSCNFLQVAQQFILCSEWQSCRKATECSSLYFNKSSLTSLETTGFPFLKPNHKISHYMNLEEFFESGVISVHLFDHTMSKFPSVCNTWGLIGSLKANIGKKNREIKEIVL